MSYSVKPCPCGQCSDWHVWPVAALQGVYFTRDQAEAVAELLEYMDSLGMKNFAQVRSDLRLRSMSEARAALRLAMTYIKGSLAGSGSIQYLKEIEAINPHFVSDKFLKGG